MKIYIYEYLVANTIIPNPSKSNYVLSEAAIVNTSFA